MTASRPETTLARLARTVKRDLQERSPQSLSAVEEALFNHGIEIQKPFQEKIRRIKAGARR